MECSWRNLLLKAAARLREGPIRDKLLEKAVDVMQEYLATLAMHMISLNTSRLIGRYFVIDSSDTEVFFFCQFFMAHNFFSSRFI